MCKYLNFFPTIMLKHIDIFDKFNILFRQFTVIIAIKLFFILGHFRISMGGYQIQPMLTAKLKSKMFIFTHHLLCLRIYVKINTDQFDAHEVRKGNKWTAKKRRI